MPDSIAMQGADLMEEIGSEYTFRSRFTKYPVFGMIIQYSDLWQDIAFYIVSGLIAEHAYWRNHISFLHKRRGEYLLKSNIILI